MFENLTNFFNAQSTLVQVIIVAVVAYIVYMIYVEFTKEKFAVLSNIGYKCSDTIANNTTNHIKVENVQKVAGGGKRDDSYRITLERGRPGYPTSFVGPHTIDGLKSGSILNVTKGTNKIEKTCWVKL